MSDRQSRIQYLYSNRSRRPIVNWSVRGMLILMSASWWLGDFDLAGWLTARRVDNFHRFVGELRPWPVQQNGWDATSVFHWATDLWNGQGADALLSTLAISVVAIVLAGLFGAMFSLLAARNLSSAEPFLPGGKQPGVIGSRVWNAVSWLTRTFLVFIRAVPEYVWAFLLLALLGPNAWPMVLALALHNTGILGKLSAEIIENVDHKSAMALRGAGANRFQIIWASVFPLSLARFLLYFFYRWETCVREATVLGMLGMASLGLLIVDSRARNRYDEMFFFILLGAGLVLLGDFVSAMSRRFVRKS